MNDFITKTLGGIQVVLMLNVVANLIYFQVLSMLNLMHYRLCLPRDHVAELNWSLSLLLQSCMDRAKYFLSI